MFFTVIAWQTVPDCPNVWRLPDPVRRWRQRIDVSRVESAWIAWSGLGEISVQGDLGVHFLVHRVSGSSFTFNQIFIQHTFGGTYCVLGIEREMFLKDNEISQIKCDRATWNPLAWGQYGELTATLPRGNQVIAGGDWTFFWFLPPAPLSHFAFRKCSTTHV